MICSRTRPRWTVIAAMAFAAATAVVASSTDAHAQEGSWRWGPPGFTEGWTPQMRTDALINLGLADPNVDYYTPWLSGAGAANLYTGVPNFSRKNEFAVDHDISSHFGIPWLGYVDLGFPAMGTNQVEVGAAIERIADVITNDVPDMLTSVTSFFQMMYDDFVSDFEFNLDFDFDITFDFDNGLDFHFDAWGSLGGGGGGGGTDGGNNNWDDDYEDDEDGDDFDMGGG